MSTVEMTATDLLARMPELGEDVAETLARAINAEWDPTRANLVLDDAAWEGADAGVREDEATNFAWSYAAHAGWELARAVAHVIEGAELVALDHRTYPDERCYRAEVSNVVALVWWGERERVGDCVPAITWARHILDEDLVGDIDGDGGWDLDPEVLAAKMPTA